jgi:hypothetical protein
MQNLSRRNRRPAFWQNEANGGVHQGSLSRAIGPPWSSSCHAGAGHP